MLRLLVADFIENGGWTDDDLATAFLPPCPDGADEGEHLTEWARTADEPALWRALCVLTLDLGRAGYPNHPASHRMSILFASALGYTPSDVELELLAGDG